MTGRETPASPHWRLRAAVVLVTLAAVAGSLIAVGLTLDRPGTERPRARTAAERLPPLDPARPQVTGTRLASFNVLGHGHTASGKMKKRWASGPERMTWAVQLIEEHGLEIIGFQEMQPPQLGRFSELTGDRWALWPGSRLTTAAMHNSIGWRTDLWRAVDKQTVKIPYFRGNLIRMPLVKLQHRTTGRAVWVFNTHNPANTHGPAWRWRKKGFRIEADMIERLRATDPYTPILVTGDKNERQKYVCNMVAWTDQHAGNGGYLHPSAGCRPGAPLKVDWTMGSPDVHFTGHRIVDKGLIDKTTDHPLIVDDVVLPAPPAAGIERVLLIDAPGLRASTLARSGPEVAPRLTALRAGGASTLEARTDPDRVGLVANTISLLTGRPVNPARGGHGVGWAGPLPATVHDSAGGYVASLFDRAHDMGRGTAFVSADRRMALVAASWDAAHGAPDRLGADNGRGKISVVALQPNDDAVSDRLGELVTGAAPALTVATFREQFDVGRRDGWESASYHASVRRLDARVGRVLDRLAAKPQRAASTLVIVTASRGGHARIGAMSRTANHRVPVIVSGPGVPAGADLYALNPDYAKPPKGPGTLDDPAPPLRVGDLANLVATVLALPSIAGSSFNAQQSVDVFGAAR